MGTWGTVISSNDTYADVFGNFFDLYNEGLEIDDITKRIIVEYQDTINDTTDNNNFWFALAKAQWECKQLDKGLFNRIKKIIETGADLEVWRQLGASENDIEKRQIALDKFLTDLQSEKPKAKPRKKKVICQPVFEKGDCLAFKLANGNYGGVVVLEAIKDTEHGYNLIVATRINQPNKPTKADFENVEVLVKNFANWDNDPIIQWYLPTKHKEVADLIEKVDTMNVQTNYSLNNSMLGFVADFDSWIIQAINHQFKSEETKSRSKVMLTIKSLL